MVAHHHAVDSSKATLGMTMFGVTTPCVTQVRETLEKDDYDCLVFHATGTGGRAMERLVASEIAIQEQVQAFTQLTRNNRDPRDTNQSGS